jgi:hypothetical protein
MIRSQNDGIEELRERIEYWRRTRQKKSPMPTELWEAAARAAHRHGIYTVAKDLRLSYDSLKKRTESREESEDTVGVGDFVEVSGAEFVGWSEMSGAEIELSDGSGRVLKISLPGGMGLDIRGLTEAFWNRQG